MVEGGMKCIKYLIFGFNFIFVLVAICLIAVGAYVQVTLKNYTNGFVEFNAAAALIIAVGVLIFFIAFFGCCGAIRENRICILVFATFLIIIFILEIAGAIAGFVLKSKTEDALRKYMNDTLRRNDSFWDEIQKDFKCCGIDSPSDWNNGTTIPESCCMVRKTNCTAIPNNVYEVGCFKEFVNWLKDRAGYVAGVALGFAFIEIVGITFACCLAVAIKKEYEVV